MARFKSSMMSARGRTLPAVSSTLTPISLSLSAASLLGLVSLRIAPRRDETDLGTLLETQEALELYIRWLDRLVGPVLQQRGGGWQTMLVADPGRHATVETEGFVAVAGPGVEAACVGPVVGELDVAPLALELQGFPRSAEMPSHAPRACIRTLPTPQAQVAKLHSGDVEPFDAEPRLLHPLLAQVCDEPILGQRVAPGGQQHARRQQGEHNQRGHRDAPPHRWRA